MWGWGGGIKAREQYAKILLNSPLCISGPVHVTLSLSVLEFYSAVRRRWITGAQDLRNVTVLSVGGGYRDYQVRSGLTVLRCPLADPNKLSLVVRDREAPVAEAGMTHLAVGTCPQR